MSKSALLKFATALVAVVLSACHTLDDNRIPVMPVYIAFNTIAEWNAYGVAGAMDYAYFNIEERIPRNYPYTAMSSTGYGGILLVSDVLGEPMAFDMACPVEVKRAVRVDVDKKTMLARCPMCGSEFDVFSLMGHPSSGPAAEKGYGLRRYSVISGSGNTYRRISY